MTTFNFTHTSITLDDPEHDFKWEKGKTYTFYVTVEISVNEDIYDSEMVAGGYIADDKWQIFYNNNKHNITGLVEDVYIDEANWELLNSNDPHENYPSNYYMTPVGTGSGFYVGLWWYLWSVQISIPEDFEDGTYYFKVAEYDSQVDDWTEWDDLKVTIGEPVVRPPFRGRPSYYSEHLFEWGYYNPTWPVFVLSGDPDDLDLTANTWGPIPDFRIEQLGGGRYKKNIVAVSAHGEIYVGETE